MQWIINKLQKRLNKQSVNMHPKNGLGDWARLYELVRFEDGLRSAEEDQRRWDGALEIPAPPSLLQLCFVQIKKVVDRAALKAPFEDRKLTRNYGATASLGPDFLARDPRWHRDSV